MVAICEEYLRSPSAWERAHGWKVTPAMMRTLVERAEALQPSISPARNQETARSVTRPGRAEGRARPLVPRDHLRVAMLSPVAVSQRVEFAEISLLFDLLSSAHPPNEFSASLMARLATRARFTLTAGSENPSHLRSGLKKLGFDIDLLVLATFEKPCFSATQGQKRSHFLRQIENANQETRYQLLLLAAPDRREALAGDHGPQDNALRLSRSLLLYGEFLRQQSQQTFEGLFMRMPAELHPLLHDVASYGRPGNAHRDNVSLLQTIRQGLTTARKDIYFLLDLCGPRTVISWARQQLVARQRSFEASLPRRRTSLPLHDDVIDRIARGRPARTDDVEFYGQMRCNPIFHQRVRDRLEYYSKVEPLKFTLLRSVCEDLDPLDVRISQPSEARNDLRAHIWNLEFQETCFRRQCEQQLNLPSSRIRPASSRPQSSAAIQTSTGRARP